MIDIRPVIPADFARIIPLMHQLGYMLSEEAVIRNLSGLCALEGNVILVAEQGNHIAGFIAFATCMMPHYEQPVGRITSFVVDEQCRNQSIGKQLLAAVHNIAARYGCIYIELTSGIGRESAHRFYEKNGYKRTSYKFILPLQENI